MLLTIVSPCYNVESYLERLLESVADEELARYVEVLIVDDGSTDATARIAADWAKRYSHIRVISQVNAGHGGAVNTGLAHARGEYFRVVDGDDWIDSEALKSELRVVEKVREAGADPDLLVDTETLIDLQDWSETYLALPEGPLRGRELDFDEVCTAELTDFFSLHNLSVRTSLLRESGLYLRENCFYVDYQFNLFATARARSVMFFDHDVYRYLIGNAAQSVATANLVKRYDQHDQVLRAVLADYRRLGARRALSDSRRDYLLLRIARLVNTQLNIALIYDPVRERGRERARALRVALKSHAREVWPLVCRRYEVAFALNLLGVDESALTRLKRLGRRLGRFSARPMR